MDRDQTKAAELRQVIFLCFLYLICYGYAKCMHDTSLSDCFISMHVMSIWFFL